jgi:hypothetical protein
MPWLMLFLSWFKQWCSIQGISSYWSIFADGKATLWKGIIIWCSFWLLLDVYCGFWSLMHIFEEELDVISEITFLIFNANFWFHVLRCLYILN